ncbi:hypothetical protein [Candidatus Scalindua japonica]|nr:hypothetical protein [Candidatus Scalindua japonica]
MQRIKKTFYIILIALGLAIIPAGSLLPVFNIYTKQAYASAPKISTEVQSAITKIKNEQTSTGSMVSEHLNVKENGQTTVKMLEIPEQQLSDIIEQWRQLGHKISEYTINNKEFIKYLINKADIKSFSYMAKIPMLYFLVKNEIAEPLLYGGVIKKIFKKISFPGWFTIAGVIDAHGNYARGYEHLGTQKEVLIGLFEGVLSKTVKGSYTIIELYTDENGERKGRFKFFETSEQTNPTLSQPIDAMAAFVLIYLNLVQENPGDIGVKRDLTIPIVQRLLTKAETQHKITAFHLKK